MSTPSLYHRERMWTDIKKGFFESFFDKNSHFEIIIFYSFSVYRNYHSFIAYLNST